uniref:Uncharacterized protein n=1 Tax=Rhizophora mucronata TaxID=61149 RepID=A0A2P2PKA9_RHIMU
MVIITITRSLLRFLHAKQLLLRY